MSGVFTHRLGVLARTAQESFAALGANYPNYGDITNPAAFYDSTEDRTWYAYEGWDGNERGCYVSIYDHGERAWFGPYLASSRNLTNDSHGNPAIIMDHEGYVHVAYGAHVGPLYMAATVNPRDPESWKENGSVGTITTYPSLALVGSTIHLFLREGTTTAGSTQRYLTHYETTSLSGGDLTFGSGQNVFDFSPNRFYPGRAVVNGTEIEMVAIYSDANDTLRRDIFHFRFDTTDGSVLNTGGGTDTAVGSQPISLASAQTNYRVYAHGSNYGANPTFCITDDGVRHIAFISDTATPWDILYINDQGTGTWTAPATISTTAGNVTPGSTGTGNVNGLTFVQRGNALQLWYPDDDGSAYTIGGPMRRIDRSAGGVWGSEQTIATPEGSFGIDPVVHVENARDDLYVFFGETTGDELDSSAGDLRLYAYGDGGFVPLLAPKFTSGPTISSTGGSFYAEDDTLSLVFEASTYTSISYQWKRDGSNISGATSATYTLVSADASTDTTCEITITNVAGSRSATTPAVSVSAGAGFSTQNRTLSDTTDRTLSDTSTRTISNRTS